MNDNNVPAPFAIKVLACVGNICLQWSLLEQVVLHLIANAEDIPMDKVYLIYGNLDMLPRIKMAIRLARHHKWPPPLIKRMEGIRSEVQGKGGKNGLLDKRNQAVHGVHKESDKPDCVSLTIVRWEGERRTQDVSLPALHQVSVDLAKLANEATGISDAYGLWKFGPRQKQNSGKPLAK